MLQLILYQKNLVGNEVIYLHITIFYCKVSNLENIAQKLLEKVAMNPKIVAANAKKLSKVAKHDQDMSKHIITIFPTINIVNSRFIEKQGLDTLLVSVLSHNQRHVIQRVPCIF